MSQTQITGKFVSAQQLFATDSFRKQTIIVEVVNGNYTSFLPVEFHNQDIDTFGPQLQMGGSYVFTCWVQGSKQQYTDKNNQPTAYVSLKCTQIAPAQQAAPQQQGGFGAAPQQQGGSIGQPAQQPAQGGFGAPTQAHPAQQQGGFGGQPAQQPSAPNFGNTPTPGGSSPNPFGGG